MGDERARHRPHRIDEHISGGTIKPLREDFEEIGRAHETEIGFTTPD